MFWCVHGAALNCVFTHNKGGSSGTMLGFLVDDQLLCCYVMFRGSGCNFGVLGIRV